MECFIVEPKQVNEQNMELLLTGDEAHHALKSLRVRPGERLLATNLIGTCYGCTLADTLDRGEVAACRIEEILPEFGEAKRDVLLIQGLLSQPARWEFVLEKATELGLRVLHPVVTERTEKVHFKIERSDRILRAAMKQTKRARMPILRLQDPKAEDARKGIGSELSSLSAALSEAVRENRKIFLLHEDAPQEHNLWQATRELEELPIAIVVGPEGGFSDSEVRMAKYEFGAEIVSLGTRRLRAETAAIAALAIAIDR